MGKKTKYNYQHYIYGDILEIKVKDGDRRTLYKAKANIKDRKRIAQILKDLEKFGLERRQLLRLSLSMRDGWFDSL